jgi:hypothetical protein
MRSNGYPASNRDHTWLNGQLRLDRGGGVNGPSDGAPWPMVELTRVKARALYGGLNATLIS